MKEKKESHPSPSQFYRTIRPENFSDSVTNTQTNLPRELLAYELSQISVNQKQDQFETFARRLCEKSISPNLIPQVGPTGGGDGKTDSETYPVSSFISERWFIPQNGWENNEKWAFCISAKTDWKAKVKIDVEKVIGTNRGYTKIYFISNQQISARKKKEEQDILFKKHNVEIIILDAEWILEKIYGNDLTDLAVDALNMSTVYKNESRQVGPNDASRQLKIDELENNINDPNRYFEFDHQLVEDCLEAAILSRKVEKPRDEVIGKFDRAKRFASKIDDPKLQLRVEYQKAWTLINWYDDFSAFIESYSVCKNLAYTDGSIFSLELLINLFNILNTILSMNVFDTKTSGADINLEFNNIIEILSKIESDQTKPASSLMASTQKAIMKLMENIYSGKSPDADIVEVQNCIVKCKGLINYPFEQYKKLLDVIGKMVPNNLEFDKLVDIVAHESEGRSSQIVSGNLYLSRAAQKMTAGLPKDGIIFFGKSVLKLAKHETEHGLYLALKGMGLAYRQLGLLWASNNCFLSAAWIALKPWYDSGKLDSRAFDPVRELAANELFIGRIPSFLNWYELLGVLANVQTDEDNDSDLQNMLDGCLAVRLSHAGIDNVKTPEQIPDLLDKMGLPVSSDVTLYNLGYEDEILPHYISSGINDLTGLFKHFELVANQPFVNQMRYTTSFGDTDEIFLESKILGCSISIQLQNKHDQILVAEMLFALLESFLATWLKGVTVTTENIIITLVTQEHGKYLNTTKTESSNKYLVKLNLSSLKERRRSEIWEAFLQLSSFIITQNFLLDNAKNKIEGLFTDEEVHERLSFVFEHVTFAGNILGHNPKLCFEDWVTGRELPVYKSKRLNPIKFEIKETIKEEVNEPAELDENTIPHNKRTVLSIIDAVSWDKAHWQGIGFALIPNKPFCIFLSFDNEAAAINIFDGWIKRFGNNDVNEEIRISIIKGIDRNNPFWYRVHISQKFDPSNAKQGHLISQASRIHTMTPTSLKNIDQLAEFYKKYKGYILCASIKKKDNEYPDPLISHGILKTELIIRNAWEIGEHDIDMAAIFPHDNPIIPPNVSDPPVLKMLEMRRNKKKDKG